jgi:hypothetical protein
VSLNHVDKPKNPKTSKRRYWFLFYFSVGFVCYFLSAVRMVLISRVPSFLTNWGALYRLSTVPSDFTGIRRSVVLRTEGIERRKYRRECRKCRDTQSNTLYPYLFNFSYKSKIDPWESFFRPCTPICVPSIV